VLLYNINQFPFHINKGDSNMFALTNKVIKSASGFNRTREQRAKHNIHYAANWIIGGYENTMEDYKKDSEEYKEAESQLANHEALVNEIYTAATTEIYEEGFNGWGGDTNRILKDIKFLGKENLMKLVEREVIKQGY
jgi:hypothetical protein